MEEKWIKYYSSSHKILLVGEGDFSFSLCLAQAFGSALNMVATSLDTQDALFDHYPEARINLIKLENLGCTILHEVDAHTMSQHPFLVPMSFDRIIFNFPHSGLSLFSREHNINVIEEHKMLVKGFLMSVRDMVNRINGEIHITHKTSCPFDKWEIEKVGEDVGLCLADKVRFYGWEYSGYDNKKGYGASWNKSFPVGQCCTFKFVISLQWLLLYLYSRKISAL